MSKTPLFKPESYVVLDTPTVWRVSDIAVQSMATDMSHNLQPQKIGAYEIVSVQINAVTIDNKRPPTNRIHRPRRILGIPATTKTGAAAKCTKNKDEYGV